MFFRLKDAQCREAFVMCSTTLILQATKQFVILMLYHFTNLNRLHEQLEHVHTEATQNIYRRQVVEGTQTDSKTVPEKCFSFSFGKSSRQFISKTNEARSKHVLALVHSDVCMYPKASLRNSKNFVTFIDNYSCSCCVCPTNENSAGCETF